MTVGTGMRGARLAREVVANHIKAAFATTLSEIRLDWGVDALWLPDPAQVEETPLPYDLLSHWPAVSVASYRVANITRLDYEAPEGPTITYETTYAIRVYVWVKADEWHDCYNKRDDYSAAMRLFLLQQPSLGRTDAKIREETVTEEFSDIQRVKGERFVAGSFIGFDLDLDESLTRAPFGEADTIDVTVHGYPASHPALE